MSDPNSHKERPTSSKLEVRIPQATSSDEQLQQIEDKNPPNNGVGPATNQGQQEEIGTMMNLTQQTVKQPEQDNPAINSPQDTDQEIKQAQNPTTISQAEEPSNNERKDITQQDTSNQRKDVENMKEEVKEEKNDSQTVHEGNEKQDSSKLGEPMVVDDPNGKSKVTDSSKDETNVTNKLEQTFDQQIRSDEKNESAMVESYNQQNTTSSKAQDPRSFKSSEPLENTRQHDESHNHEVKASETVNPAMGNSMGNEKQMENTIKEPITESVVESENRQLESSLPPSVDEPKVDKSVHSISQSEKKQYPQPSSGQNEKKLDMRGQTETSEVQQANQDSQIENASPTKMESSSNETGQTRAQSSMSTSSQRETRKSSAASSRNLEAMQAVLDTRKESGTGFVLSSPQDDQENDTKADRTTEESIEQRQPPDGENELQASSTKQPKLSKAKFKPTTPKSEDTTYMTETPDNFQTNLRDSSSHTYSPTYIDTAARQPPEGGIRNIRRKSKKTKRDIERERVLARLNLSRPPPKYALTLQPLKADPDPSNKAPLNPNIYYATVPKSGGIVKTPFYVQVHIPDGALDGEVRLKFERQEFDRMKLGLTGDDTLCSCIIDLNMEPMSYCLRQNATIRMRILDKCVNPFEETVIITSRHFSWARTPTKVETRTVNGEKHYYAVTESQVFGKFAVINTQRMDRFIITKAGGDFLSTIVPGVTLSVEEDQLSSHPPQMVEMIVRDTKDDAVKQTSKEMPTVQGSHGKLIGASPVIEISKDLMAQSGRMKHGVRFPETISLHIPVPRPALTHSDASPTKKVVIVRKHTNPQYNTINGYRYHPNAYSTNAGHTWKDITYMNRMAADSVTFRDGESINLQITAPGKYMVLAFEADLDSEEGEFNLDDMSNAITETNHEHEINVMIHQKTAQPSVITVHMVTSDAVEPISKAMESTKTWQRVYQSKQLVMHEWQPIKLEFKGDLKPTVNQMTPEIRFYSKRWQGYQFQLEATDEAFAKSNESIVGTIAFMQEECCSVRKSMSTLNLEENNEKQCVCEATIEIEQEKARPFKPTVVVKEIPKVPIYREYKMNWLKHLSPEDIERYKAAHGM